MQFAKNTQRDTSRVLRLPRKMTMDTSKVLRLPRKLQHIFWKRRKSIAPATQNDFRHVAEHVWMSRSATPATRNEATTHWKPPKMTTSAELPIGTAIRSLYGRLRTVANGCGRLRPQTQRRANTPSTPRPPEWNGNPCYAFGKQLHGYLADKISFICFFSLPICGEQYKNSSALTIWPRNGIGCSQSHINCFNTQLYEHYCHWTFLLNSSIL